MQLEKTLGDPLGGRGLTFTPFSTHKRTLFFFHGLGDNAYGAWEFVVELAIHKLPVFEGTKIVLPTANVIPITMFNGAPSSAWADLTGLDVNSDEDVRGWNKSYERIRMLIDNEVKKFEIPAKDIYLAGFSMGGALAYLSALRYPETLGGCLSISGFLPLRKEGFETSSWESRSVPFVHFHGSNDDVVSIHWGKRSSKSLLEEGYQIETKIYPGVGHEVCPEEMKDVKETLIGWITNPPVIEPHVLPKTIISLETLKSDEKDLDSDL
eukprot:GHVP01066324.1.p1 GENE.GHVP01066324.1~~GHVP01066324.1.p1  ORF type:complete len:267 (+),score=41.16 GHVP01066324.1:484-1284(+)